jgi:hypothetical protein
MTGRSGEQRPVSPCELRSRYLSAQDLELMPQHQQIDAFHVKAAATTNERAKQSPHGEVEEGEGHAADPPRPGPPRDAARILAPFRGRELCRRVL